MIKVPQQQIPGVYHRRVGDIVVTAISDGFLDGSLEVLRNIAPGGGPPDPRPTTSARRGARRSMPS